MNSKEPVLNPYLSPRTESAASNATGDVWLGNYNPVIMPRDFTDTIASTCCGLLLALFIYGVPFLVLYLFQAPAVFYLVAIVVIVGIAVFAMLVGIHRVELTPDGIVAVRKIMRPVRIPWSDVKNVRIATRGAVMLATIFCPHRCCSYSMTSRDQVSIRASRVWILFPAQDHRTFLTTAMFYCDAKKRSK